MNTRNSYILTGCTRNGYAATIGNTQGYRKRPDSRILMAGINGINAISFQGDGFVCYRNCRAIPTRCCPSTTAIWNLNNIPVARRIDCRLNIGLRTAGGNDCGG